MEGAGCPEQAAVQDALEDLDVAWRKGKLKILETQEETTVIWEDASGETAQKRVLPRLDDCGERAQAVAIVLTALWSTPALQTPVPSDDHITVTSSRDEPAPAQQTRTSSIELSLGAMAMANGDRVGWGGRADVVWHKLASDLGLSAALEATAPQTEKLGQGEVRWNRLSTMMGPAFRFQPSRQVTATWDAMLALSLWLVRGEGFALNQRSFSVAPGGSSAMRLSIPLPSAIVWMELRGLAWPGTRSFEVTSARSIRDDRKELSPWELQLNLGVAFSVR